MFVEEEINLLMSKRSIDDLIDLIKNIYIN